MAARRSARALNGQNIVTHQPWTPRAASCLRPAARGRGGCARPTHLAACQCAGARRAGTHAEMPAASQSAPPRRQQRRRESRAEADPRATARRGRQGRWNRSGAAAPPRDPRALLARRRVPLCGCKELLAARREEARAERSARLHAVAHGPARRKPREANHLLAPGPPRALRGLRRTAPQDPAGRGHARRMLGAGYGRPQTAPARPAPLPCPPASLRCRAARDAARYLMDDKRLWDVARREPAVAKVASPLIHLARCPLSVRPRPLPRLPPAPFRRLALHLEARSRPSF